MILHNIQYCSLLGHMVGTSKQEMITKTGYISQKGTIFDIVKDYNIPLFLEPLLDFH